MPEIKYTVGGTKPPFTVELRSGSTVLQSNVHAAAGAYSFTGVTDGFYELHIVDSKNCTMLKEAIVDTPVEQPPMSYTGHKGSGRYDRREDAYNLGTDYPYTLYTEDGSLSTGQSIYADDQGAFVLADGWYRIQNVKFPDTAITMQVYQGLIHVVMLGSPYDGTTDPGTGPQEPGDGPIQAP